MRVYLDTAPIIYLIEDVSPYVGQLASRLSAVGIRQVCSQLTRLECRVKPLRDNNTVLLEAYDRYFTEIISELLPLTPAVIDKATELRARHNFRTPDALHLASAILFQCDLFLTNDQQLKRCNEIPVDVISY